MRRGANLQDVTLQVIWRKTLHAIGADDPERSPHETEYKVR
jgi:hypothetical protein